MAFRYTFWVEGFVLTQEMLGDSLRITKTGDLHIRYRGKLVGAVKAAKWDRVGLIKIEQEPEELSV